MTRNPIFDLFEIICVELSSRTERVIAETDIDSVLMESIQDFVEEPSPSDAFAAAVEFIAKHFQEREARLPYAVDMLYKKFSVVDQDFVDFIAFAKSNRGVGGDESKNFETRTLKRLRQRLTGDLRRVG